MKIYAFAVIICVVTLYSSTIYVKWDAVNNDGKSWETAFADMQSALNTAVSGDQIWVAAGTYKPTWDYGLGGSRYNHFRMMNGVSIYGGFIGTEDQLSERDYRVNETVFSGDIGNQGDMSDNCYHIFYHPDGLFLDNTAVIDGFTIRNANGNISSWPHGYGAGFFNYTSSPTVRNCLIRNNYSQYYGAGIYNYEEADAKIINCFIQNNQAANGGGGAGSYHSTPVFTNCVISGNSAVYGGGLYDESTYAIYNNCTISNNSGTLGGGFYTYYCYSLQVNNSIVWGNIASSSGKQFYNYRGTVTLNYSDYSNGAGDVYNNGTTFTATNQCLTSDPLFSDAPNGDYTLQEASPCVNSGSNAYNIEIYDIAGNLRIQNSTIDRGAYEFVFLTQPVIYINYNEAGTVFVNWDLVAGASSYKVYESDDPYLGFALAGTYALFEHQHIVSDNKKFFYVVATTEAVKK